MNILTFDIEEWYLEKRDRGNRPQRIALYDKLFGDILDLLDERGLKATFFCVGGMANDFPHVVRLIDSRGHEIGCHSNTHTWLNKMTRDEAFDDTKQAICSLEQCLGKNILSYRAPAFSIGENNKWAFEVLAECGIERDASIFPAQRDFGGFPDFGAKKPSLVSYNGITIKEFPICTASILSKQVAYSGGGYFRFFPLWFAKREIYRNDYAMCYFHISDLIAETSRVMSRKEFENYFKENGSFLNRYKRYLKSNIGKKNAWKKLVNLIKSEEFINIKQADDVIDWGKCTLINL